MNLLVCGGCGALAEDPRVEPHPPTLVCVECGHRQPFRRLPLWCVTGASGTGKSTVARLLAERLGDRYVVLEQDVLWLAGLRDPADNHRSFRSAWLRMAAMIHQSGRPVLLCGTVAPPEFEPLAERVLFAGIHYLALVCEPAVLARRLRARPAWREWSEPRIAETLEFNEWIRASASATRPPMGLVDTTHESTDTVVARIRAWLDDPAPAAPSTGEGCQGE